MDLSISIVTVDKGFILRCLQSIYQATKTVRFEIYVVINLPAIAEEVEQAIRDRFREVHVIANEQEEGFSRSHNRAIGRCRGRYVLVLNDDTIIGDGAFDKMLEYMDQHPDIGMLGCKLLNADGTVQWSCGKSPIHKVEYFKCGALRTLLSPLIRDQFFGGSQEVSWITGACMLVRAEAVQKAGMLDENFQMYYEDGEWCYRIIKAGWKVFFFADAEVTHYRGETNKRNAARALSFYYRSRLYFFYKHFDAFTCFAVRVLTIFDAILGYIKLVVRRSALANREVLKAYLGAIKLALTYRPEM